MALSKIDSYTLYERHGAVALITLSHPPVNSLNQAMRASLMAHWQQAMTDSAVQAVVLTGAGRAFSAGADIQELGTGQVFAEPHFHTLIHVLENSVKPVVAALHSVCAGGALELALACHYRIAAPGCHMALPEVKLGLLPGAGGTQRLPRVLGVEAALSMMLRAAFVRSEVLAQIPGQKLLNRLAQSADSLLPEALAWAVQIAAVRPLPRVRDLPCQHAQGPAYFAQVRQQLTSSPHAVPALSKCVDAVEVATQQPFEAGLAFEYRTFLALLGSPESQALRHVFKAARAAAKIAGLSVGTPVRAVRTLGIVGAGTMGVGIAILALNAELPVTLLDVAPAALEQAQRKLRQHYEAQRVKGKLNAEQLEQRLSLLSLSVRYEDLQTLDMVIEAAPEDLDLKKNIFTKLDQVMKPGAILASNTSTLDLNVIASVTQRPQDVVGTHFFSPAQVMRLLEVVRTDSTAQDVLATVLALAKTWQKTVVVAGVCDGFIGNRMLTPYMGQALALLQEGATPAQVDQAIERFGFAMGPFRMVDLAGNDIAWAIRQQRYQKYPDLPRSLLADALYAQGRYGQKTGAGWYDYPNGPRQALESAAVLQMIEAQRQARGTLARRISEQEITQRLVYALVNEAAHILQEGIAAKASDIDVIYTHAYGFPASRGGPLWYADQQGLAQVMQTMRQFASNAQDHDAQCWAPAPLLARLAAQGARFHPEAAAEARAISKSSVSL